VASHKATGVLHRVMRIAPYQPGGMGIKIVVYMPAFFVMVDAVIAHNHSLITK
jgi:hypothetical protein